MPKPIKFTLSWKVLFTQTVLAAYGYVFMEWLFFATKASFMDAMPLWNKLQVFLLTALVPALTALPVLFVLRLLGWIPGPTKRAQVFLLIGAVLPAVLYAAVSLLMIDNFTYTVFKFGIVTSRGFGRAAYAVLAVALLALWYRQVLLNVRLRLSKKTGRGKSTAWQKVQGWIVLVLLAVSLTVAGVRLINGKQSAGEKAVLLKRQPNIVLIGSDGVTADRMSLYGYNRATTPRLEQLAASGLLSENNFSNAAHTTGSVFSMLTGKYPATTRLLYSPNILQGQDALQHLPGILQRAGYTTIELTFAYYIDAYTINMQEGFDEVNGRSLGQGPVYQLARKYNLGEVGYFVPRLLERISDRALHIFFIRVMPDPYRQVLTTIDPNSVTELTDEQKINRIFYLLLTSNRPVFIHVHLMGTHGGKFDPPKRVFSAGEVQSREWMPDFYDDAVLGFDSYIGTLVDRLTDAHLMDKTVFAIYSDHADQWRTNDKIPLLFRFPNGQYAGRLHNNTQNLDIAPTLLDYLGMEKPAWMPGLSLLHGEPPAKRPIISMEAVGVDCQPPDWWCVLDPAKVKPPFYQFGSIQVVICDRMYTLELNTNQWTEMPVNKHTAPCKPTDMPDRTAVYNIMLEHLQSNGFDVSSLK
jgi:hypothetical protein